MQNAKIRQIKMNHSFAHGRGLREEHCSVQRVLRDHEAAAETFHSREEQTQAKVEKLLVENSHLRAQLCEAKQKLESEVKHKFQSAGRACETVGVTLVRTQYIYAT